MHVIVKNRVAFWGAARGSRGGTPPAPPPPCAPAIVLINLLINLSSTDFSYTLPRTPLGLTSPPDTQLVISQPTATLNFVAHPPLPKSRLRPWLPYNVTSPTLVLYVYVPCLHIHTIRALSILHTRY